MALLSTSWNIPESFLSRGQIEKRSILFWNRSDAAAVLVADPERRFWGRRPPLDGVELMSGREYSAAAKKADCRAEHGNEEQKAAMARFFSL